MLHIGTWLSFKMHQLQKYTEYTYETKVIKIADEIVILYREDFP